MFECVCEWSSCGHSEFSDEWESAGALRFVEERAEMVKVSVDFLELGNRILLVLEKVPVKEGGVCVKVARLWSL